MKILKNNIIKPSELNLRLKLEVKFESQLRYLSLFKKIDKVNLNKFYQTTNGIIIADSITDPEAGLDIDFEVERTNSQEPNETNITIWNLSEDAFYQLASKSNKISLYFAKGKNDWSLLTSGTPSFSTKVSPQGGNNSSRGFLKRDDAVGGENDIATTITLLESVNLYEEVAISKSYDGDISISTILNDCANLMGVSFDDTTKNGSYLISPIEDTYVNNYVARGRVIDVVKDLVNRIGAKFSLENNILNVYLEEEGLNSEGYYYDFTRNVKGYHFTPENSSLPEAEQDKNNILYHFTTQLIPDISVGSYCLCDLDTLRGVRQINKVLISGNNYGTAGQTEIWVK